MSTDADPPPLTPSPVRHRPQNDDSASVQQLQQAWEAVRERVRAAPGVVRVQRLCCGTCLDYKLIISITAPEYSAAADHGPDPASALGALEAEFLAAARAIDGVTQVGAQLYSIMDA